MPTRAPHHSDLSCCRFVAFVRRTSCMLRCKPSRTHPNGCTDILRSSRLRCSPQQLLVRVFSLSMRRRNIHVKFCRSSERQHPTLHSTFYRSIQPLAQTEACAEACARPSTLSAGQLFYLPVSPARLIRRAATHVRPEALSSFSPML